MHPGRGVDGVPEEAVPRHLGSDDSGHDRSGVDAGLQVDGVGLLVRPHHHPGGGIQVDGHRADLLGVLVAVLLWQARGHLFDGWMKMPGVSSGARVSTLLFGVLPGVSAGARCILSSVLSSAFVARRIGRLAGASAEMLRSCAPAHHAAVRDGLHLVDVELVHPLVHDIVQGVQELDHLSK